MPPDGPDVLASVLEACPTCEVVAELSIQERSAEEWQEYFTEEAALTGRSEAEVLTLISYLAINFPSTGVRDLATLPRGGRYLVMMNCQLCHSIAIPLTQTRSLERWLEHRRTSPHDSLSLNAVQWDTIAHYLTYNTPLPLEAIPEELRMGAGGY